MYRSEQKDNNISCSVTRIALWITLSFIVRIIGIRTKQSIEYNSCGTLSFRNISEDIFSKYTTPNSLIINNLYYFIRFLCY